MNALEEATRRALRAAENGDLDALSSILNERQRYLGTITEDSLRAFDLGEITKAVLSELKKRIVAEHVRLEQLRKGFAEPENVSRIQLEG